MNNEYHVHIACIGDIKEPTMAIVRSGTGIDEVVLLNNNNSEYVQRQKEIEETLKESFIPRIVSEEIDIFDFQMITKKLIDIVKRCRTEHPGCTIHFNITAGTNIVGSAMCVVAMRFQNTDIYYQKWKKHDPKLENDKVIHVELADDKSLGMLLRQEKTADILRLFAETDVIEHRDLLNRSGMKPSTLSYHTKKLTESGLINRGGSNRRTPTWNVTEKGAAVLERFFLIDEH